MPKNSKASKLVQKNKTFNNKLCAVMNMLYESKSELKSIENKIESLNIRKNIMLLIKKNEMFASELANALTDMEGMMCPEYENILKMDGWKMIYKETSDHSKGALEKLKKLEILFEKAYREVLNTWFYQVELRNMMRQQLNELKCVFLKLKLEYLGLE